LFDLVNRRRHVTVAWQRGKGPAFVAAFMNAVRSGDGEFPKQVAGRSLEDLLKQMFAAMQHEGSARLRQAVEEEREFLSRIASRCDSLDDLFEFLQQEEAATAQV
jgi:hypothetical protein